MRLFMENRTEKDIALERFAALLASILEKYAEKVDVNSLPDPQNKTHDL